MPTDPLAEALRKQSIDSMNIDPAAQRLSEESRIEGRLSFPEEQARRRAAIDAQRKMYEQEFDPERQRREGLKQFLINAGGRRYGEFAGGARGAMAFDKDQSTARQTRLKGLEDMEQGLFGLKKGAVEGGIGAGQKAGEQASVSQRQGMDTGSRVYGTETQSRDNALSREIERMKANIQAETNNISRAGVDLSRAQSVYSNNMNKLRSLLQDMDTKFQTSPGIGMLLNADPKSLTAEERTRIDVARTQHELAKARLKAEVEEELTPIKNKLGMGNAANLSEADKALIAQFQKGK
jgi:hypothetical protein